MKNVSYRIRKLRQEEIHILDDFLYEAIFIPEGTKAPPKEIIKEPELQVYVADFGEKKDDICVCGGNIWENSRGGLVPDHG